MAPIIDDEDICRFCRSEGTPDKPLFHPCVCAGSIKYIHQDCLVHWLKYSEKEYCELCNHRFSFTNIYSPDMPERLPLNVLFLGIFKNSARAVQRWFHLALVTLAWGVLAPVIACRLYKLFLYDTPPSGIHGQLLDLFTMSDIINDIFHGCCIVSCSMVAFISLAWLKDQIIRHGGPDWQDLQDVDTQTDDIEDDEDEEESDDHQIEQQPTQDHHATAASMNSGSSTLDEEDIYFDTSDTIINNETTSEIRRALSTNTINNLITNAQLNNTQSDLLSSIDRDSPSTSQSNVSRDVIANLDSQLKPGSRNNDPPDQLTRTSFNSDIQEITLPRVNAPNSNQNLSSNIVNSSNPPVNQNNSIRDPVAEPEEAEPQDIEVNNEVNPNNWNNEWEINEEITWERIVGLDGSFVYVQHVFWVICLSSLFILLFAFIPYKFGNSILSLLGLKLYVSMAPFHGFITSIIGFFSVGVLAVLFGALATLAKFKRLARVMNFSYIIIRITIFLVFELGLLPFLCGWLIDLSTLPLINGTIQERYNQLLISPYLSTTVHWTMGFVYSFKFLLFVCLLKEVVKPKVLAIFYNFEDPSYNPMPEIIQESIWQFIRCFVGIAFLMISSIFLLAYLPVRAVKYAMPQFLPYIITINNEVTELTIEFFMLLLLFPTVIDYGNFRNWLTILVRFWCIHVTKYLGLESYLQNHPSDSTSDRVIRENPSITTSNRSVAITSEQQDQEHLAIEQRGDRTDPPQADEKRHMIWKLTALASMISITLFLVGIILVTVPALIGRAFLALWFGPKMKIHECTTISVGLFWCFIGVRLSLSLYGSLPLSFGILVAQTKRWVIITTKAIIVTLIFLGFIPFLVGLIFDVTLIIPRRVSNYQTPIFYLWQDWIFGILLSKVIGVLIMLSPGRMRDALEELYQAGMTNIRLKLVFTRLAGPIISVLGAYLSIPYIVANLFLPYLGVSPYTVSAINRDMYGWLMYTAMGIILGSWQFAQFYNMHDNIRNERYMVGRRLVNYQR